MNFYSVGEPMRGYAGDTFPVFRVYVSGIELSGCSMRMVLEERYQPGKCVMKRNCTQFEDPDGRKGFQVTLGSEDTQQLLGMYHLFFILTDAGGKEYRKFITGLEVLQSPEEDE